jgi:multicomponent Na+:H+ antiporter subunit E
LRFLATWLVFAALWLGLSGHFDVVHLVFGAASVTLVAALSWRHFIAEGPLLRGVARILRLGAYTPWLLWQITLANWDVLLRVLGVRPVEPRLVRVESPLETDFGTVAFANSITLTPGTVTIEIGDGHLVVHAIAPDALTGLVSGEMVRRIQAVEGRAR